MSDYSHYSRKGSATKRTSERCDKRTSKHSKERSDKRTQKAQISGFILDRKDKDSGEDLLLLTSKSRATWTIKCKYHCPCLTDDRFYAVGTIKNPEDCPAEEQLVFRVNRPPLVLVPCDETGIRRFIERLFKGTKVDTIDLGLKVDRLTGLFGITLEEAYSQLAASFRNDYNEVTAMLKPAARIAYNERVTPSTVEMIFRPLPSWAIKKLLWSWYYDIELRQLELLGLSKEDIRNCKLPLRDIKEHCLNNPFRLYSLSVELGTEILRRRNHKVSPRQIRLAEVVRYIWHCFQQKGWTACPVKNVQKKFDDLEELIPDLIETYDVHEETFRVNNKPTRFLYLDELWQVETFVAEKVNQRLTGYKVPGLPDLSDPIFSDSVTPDQRAAIKMALNQDFSIITGEAGTGKTRTISEITTILEYKNIPYCVVSFTGKAVSRIKKAMKEQGCQTIPTTIHRMIFRGTHVDFRYLIIDEMSMTTTFLLFLLLKAFPHEYRIVLVGDNNQLPPIEGGEVFTELLAESGDVLGDQPLMGKIHATYLTINHRIEKNPRDAIIVNARKLLTTRRPSQEPTKFRTFTTSNNFVIVEGDLSTLTSIVRGMVEADIDPRTIAVMTPCNEEVDQINPILQKLLNPKGRQVKDSKGRRWRKGDRVMIWENRDQDDLYNGDEGYLVEVNESEVEVEFATAGKKRFSLQIPENYSKKDMHVGLLKHSWCTTAHKKQGDESSVCIGYFEHGAGRRYSFVDQRMMYTFFSRASKMFYLCGDIQAAFEACNREPRKKHETLRYRIGTKGPESTNDSVSESS